MAMVKGESMSQFVKDINKFTKNAVKSEMDKVKEELLLSDRQDKIFHMYYIRRLDINFIADELGVCPLVISNELKTIRKKLAKVLGLD